MKFKRRKPLSKPCDYCGGHAYYRFSTGKRSYCCSDNIAKCPGIKKINSDKAKIRLPRKHSEETKQKIRSYRHTEDAKKKISEFHSGKPKSEEHRINLSKSRIGRSDLTNKGSFKKGNVPWNKGKKGLQKAWNKGKPRSQKTKDKISETRIKRLESGEIVITEETKLKAAEARRGQTRSKETKLKMSIAASGEKSSQWQGGISCEPYCDAWLDKDFKNDIFERDGCKCQNPDCRRNTDKLCRHHVDYDKKNCHYSNVITACFSCNSRANTNRRFWQTFYQNIMTEKYGYRYSYREAS